MIKKTVLILIMILLLFSCFTNKIFLNADKNSGVMIIEYVLNEDYLQLVSIASENLGKEKSNNSDEVENFDPAILIDRNLFIQNFKASNDLVLKSVNIDSSNGIYKGKIVIEFKNLEEVMQKLPEGLINLKLKKINGILTLTQILNYKELDPEGVFKDFVEQQKVDDINLYNKLTKEAKFSFIVESALPIKSSEGVKLSGDKKKAEYTFKLGDLLNNENKTYKFMLSF